MLDLPILEASAEDSALKGHILYPLCVKIAEEMTQEVSSITCAMVLSLISAIRGYPVSLAICSDAPFPESQFAHSFLNFFGNETESISPIPHSNRSVIEEFEEFDVVLVRGANTKLSRQISWRAETPKSPAFWLVSDCALPANCLSPFINLYCQNRHSDLRRFTLSLPVQPTLVTEEIRNCFRQARNVSTCSRRLKKILCQAQTSTESDSLIPLTAMRFAQSAAAIRAAIQGVEHVTVSADDYSAIFELLQRLPHSSRDTTLSGQAIGVVECIRQKILIERLGRELPDRSSAGSTYFDCTTASEWIGCSYNTAKTRLADLEMEGLIESTLCKEMRTRGKQVYYRLCDRVGSLPTEHDVTCLWSNPFASLPTPIEISASFATDCNELLQS